MTAVEWLFAQMSNVSAGFVTELNELEILQKAKAMHKEEIEKAWKESRLTHPMIGFKHETFDKYYNETYGGDK